MLDVAEDREQEEAGQGRADQLDDDVAGQPFPGEVAAQGEGEGDGRVEVGAGDGAHEEDDRQDHQARRDHRGRQADLPLGVEQAAAGGDEHQDEGPEQLREEAAPLQARVVEVLAVAELERQQVPGSWSQRNAGEVVLGRLAAAL